MISAAFGFIYVFANTVALPVGWAWTLRGAAAAVFTAVLIDVVRAGRFPGTAAESMPARSVFGWRYGCVVGIEIVAACGGARILSGPLHAPQASIAWVSLVVGTHFFALAAIFAQQFFRWLGGAITACGAVGILLALVGARTGIIAMVAGVIPGALLLAFGWWGALRRPRAERSDRSEPVPVEGTAP